MSLNNNITSFGVYQVVFSDYNNPSIKGSGKILGDFTPETTQELVDLRGGSSPYPWGSAPGEAEASISVTIKQYDKNVLRFLNPYIDGAIVEDPDGDTGGYVSTIQNILGTSVVDATTGIASIAVDGATKDELAYGEYIAKAVDATSIDLYVDTDLSGKAPYINDDLKINDTPIIIPGTGGTVTYKGVTFTGGSGAIAMTPGDLAKFSVRPVNTYLMQNIIGKVGANPKEFSLMVAAEVLNDRIRVVRYPRCICGGGGNLKFPYKEWATIETTIKILQSRRDELVGIEEFINR
jgi:hypothetical protein